MTEQEIVKKLEDVEKQVKYLINQLKNNKEMSPTQKAIKVVTGSKSTTQQVKAALQTLVQSPTPLSVKQVSFITYFAFLNKTELGDDIEYWFSIQLGKHRYNERTSFIEQMQEIIKNNYKNNMQFSNRLITYLEGKKK